MNLYFCPDNYNLWSITTSPRGIKIISNRKTQIKMEF